MHILARLNWHLSEDLEDAIDAILEVWRCAAQQAVAADNPAAVTSYRIEAPARRRACS
jgi:hypothetical protein